MSGALPGNTWISGLCLEGNLTDQYMIENREGIGSGFLLENLAPVTIFVGANNAGKSRLLREIFRLRSPKFARLSRLSASDNSISELARKMAQLVEQALQRKTRIKSRLGTIDDQRVQPRPNRPTSDWFDTWAIDLLEKQKKSLHAELSKGAPGDREQAATYRATQKWNEEYLHLQKEIPQILDFHGIPRHYVPILRGMRPPLAKSQSLIRPEISADIYQERTMHDYFLDELDGSADDKYALNTSIFTGLGLYDDIRMRLLGKTQQIRDTIRSYEEFLSKTFFSGLPVTLVPVEDGENDVVHIKIGSTKEHPIYELGDGMQSLIICTYPIVTETRPGSLFFLEEPDICMHPSLQRTFMDFLKTYHRKMGHQFFLTTHSNHLLDLVDDLDLFSVLSFTKNNDLEGLLPEIAPREENRISAESKSMVRFRIRSTVYRDRNVLSQLGVRPSATFLANATIWVEGVSEVAYLRAYMKAFLCYVERAGGKVWGDTAKCLKRFREDSHYAFVEYNGTNLTHFRFGDNLGVVDDELVAEVLTTPASTSSQDLCAEAFVIADGDILDRGKGNRAQRFASQLGNRFMILPCKEIENLVPDCLVKLQVLQDLSDTVESQNLAKIEYGDYCRLPYGIGRYLSKTRRISLYGDTSQSVKGTGTLTGYRKSIWRDPVKGIPAKLQKILDQEDSCKDIENASSSLNLPAWMTQDMIWLCSCIYLHIAKCNHVEDASRQIDAFCNWMTAESSSVSSEASFSWPIAAPNKGQSDQSCLLSLFNSSRLQIKR
jgi:hypothetical protein